MTKAQADEIRRIIDTLGWDGVRRHRELWAAWIASLEADRRYIDQTIDR
jgi:hypothetical protein